MVAFLVSPSISVETLPSGVPNALSELLFAGSKCKSEDDVNVGKTANDCASFVVNVAHADKFELFEEPL